MIHVLDHAGGCIVPVRAQPGARRDGIAGIHNGAVKIAVTAPPDKGKANEALAAVLAEALNVKKAQIQLTAGPTSRDKRFLIQGLTANVARQRLTAACSAMPS